MAEFRVWGHQQTTSTDHFSSFVPPSRFFFFFLCVPCVAGCPPALLLPCPWRATGIGAKWLRSFHDFDARERGGTFSNSDAYLLAMLTAPPRTITVSAGYGRSPIRREYTMDIVPSKYAARVLAARRALAAEWVADLARIDADNAAVRVRALERSLRPVTRRWMPPPLPEGVAPAPMSTAAMEAAAAATAAAAAQAAAAEAAEAAAAAAAASAEFAFASAPATGTSGATGGDADRDGNADADEEYVSTPLRARNYASLKLLATKHALTRLLLGARDTAGRGPEYLFLQRFLRVQAAAADGGPATTCGDALLASLAATAVVSAVTATSVPSPVRVVRRSAATTTTTSSSATTTAAPAAAAGADGDAGGDGGGDGSPTRPRPPPSAAAGGFTIPTMVALVGGGVDGAEMLGVALDVRAAIAADWAAALRDVPAEQHALQVRLLRRSLDVASGDVCAPANGEDRA